MLVLQQAGVFKSTLPLLGLQFSCHTKAPYFAMPRPPVSRVRTRPVKTANPATTSAPALESQPQKNGPSSDIYDVSDREKEKVATRRKSLRDSTSTRNRNISTETIQQQKSLDRAKERRDAAMERLQNITSTDNSDGEEAGVDDVADASPSPSQRVKATPLRSRPTDLSGLDLDDSMFDDLNTTLDTAGPASAHRSAETSTLSVSQFRRRPRAGSFLSRDDGPIRPSSRAGSNTPAFGSTLNFGVFKRRAREPSILSTAQKPRAQRPEPEQETEADDDNEEDEDEPDEDGFGPEAESTPLRRSTRRSGAAEIAQPTSTSSAKSRKRKSTGTHTQRFRSSPFEVRDHVRQSIEQPAASDDESPLSSPPALPQHVPSTPIAPAMDPALMAPPLSSDSESEEEAWPDLKSIPKTRTRQAASVLRQTPNRDHSASDMSSPPSLTHSPNYAHSSSPPPAREAKPKRKAAPKPVRKVTTADLTGLLPRRRRKAAEEGSFGIDEDESEAEVDISGLGEGDDELGNLDIRTKRRPASRANARHQPAIKARTSARNKNKPAQDSNKRISRTYGRLSDKENADEDEEGNEGNDAAADLGEEDSQMLVERLGEELKGAVRKFQEVDKWELSFEERARSSSPVNAR